MPSWEQENGKELGAPNISEGCVDEALRRGEVAKEGEWNLPDAHPPSQGIPNYT